MSKYSRPFQIILAGETGPQKTADAVIIALLGLWHNIKDKSVQPRGAVITAPAQFKQGQSLGGGDKELTIVILHYRQEHRLHGKLRMHKV